MTVGRFPQVPDYLETTGCQLGNWVWLPGVAEPMLQRSIVRFVISTGPPAAASLMAPPSEACLGKPAQRRESESLGPPVALGRTAWFFVPGEGWFNCAHEGHSVKALNRNKPDVRIGTSTLCDSDFRLVIPQPSGCWSHIAKSRQVLPMVLVPHATVTSVLAEGAILLRWHQSSSSLRWKAPYRLPGLGHRLVVVAKGLTLPQLPRTGHWSHLPFTEHLRRLSESGSNLQCRRNLRYACLGRRIRWRVLEQVPE